MGRRKAEQKVPDGKNKNIAGNWLNVCWLKHQK